MNGKTLSKKWNVKIIHALYRKSGDWYHQLKAFPGAYFDENGYVLFNSEKEYLQCTFLDIKKDVHVRNGISSIPHYINMSELNFTNMSPDTLSLNNNLFIEGRIKTIKLNKYERNIHARKKCIEHFGTTCMICETSLESIYGNIANGIIHVHHLTPISILKKDYIVDPINDLVPVCPNCHHVIHAKFPPYSIEEVKEMISETSNKV